MCVATHLQDSNLGGSNALGSVLSNSRDIVAERHAQPARSHTVAFHAAKPMPLDSAAVALHWNITARLTQQTSALCTTMLLQGAYSWTFYNHLPDHA